MKTNLLHQVHGVVKRSIALTCLVLCLLVPAWILAGNPPHLAPLLQVVYIYGYNNTMVVAEAKNATKAQVAYSSFESAEKGFWTYSGTPAGSAADPGRTGVKYYNTSTGQIQRTGLPAGRYILSYWASADLTVTGTNYTLVRQLSGTAINGWSYYEKVVNISAAGGVINLNGSVKVDELRLYPFEAEMITFTYDPLIGKTSETDTGNATIFYEYDEFNRLMNIKDQYGNIIKNHYYHY